MNEKNFMDLLFSPLSLGNLHLSNRIVMPPMTRGFSPAGIPGADVAEYYKKRAENEVGLIVTEGTLIEHPAAGQSKTWPLFYGEKPLQGWRKVVEAVHAVKGKIVPQLWHVGTARQKDAAKNPNPEVLPIGPSGIDVMSLQKVSEPMSHAEIESVIAAYAAAARNAKEIGFDGIEIHGAHGYLIDQFFWDKTNLRTDEYGGDLIARTRFAAEIIKACRREVGKDFPIIFRFSQWKTNHYDVKMAQNPEELEAFLKPLSEAGTDIFHASTRRYWLPEFEGSELNLAGWTKKITGKPVITVGSVGLDTNFIELFTHGKGGKQTSIEPMLAKLSKNEFDLVSVGRALLADAAWARKIHEGRGTEIIPFEKKCLDTLL